MKLLTMLALTSLLSIQAMAATPAPVVNCTASATRDGESEYSITENFVQDGTKAQTLSKSTTTKKTTRTATLTANSSDNFTKSLTVELEVLDERARTFARTKETDVEAQTMDIDLNDKGPWSISKRIGNFTMDFICTDARPEVTPK